MSFPTLIIGGDPANRVITSITLEYGSTDDPGQTKYLIRDKYDVTRETVAFCVATGTSALNSNMRYDRCRTVHRWIGHADVLTESVMVHEAAPGYAVQNNQLIKGAVVLNMVEGEGITHQGMYTALTQLDPGSPNIDGSILVQAYEGCPSWVMKTETNGDELYTSQWFIRNISITDNGNKTSRIVFQFEAYEAWVDLVDVFTQD